MSAGPGKRARGRRSQSDFDACFPLLVCVLGIRTDGAAVAEIVFLSRSASLRSPVNALAQKVCEQLERYLKDPEFRFSLPLKHGGTEHQRAVWSEMRKIRSGRTMSYGEIAARLGSGPRAVGQACGANPIVVVVPCHRVVASAGLGGFAHRDQGFPLTIKRWLLDHEHAQW
jgi:methylated-DNA-[protein]-cysteine S-methyltransferase